jgi:hypothetical protein
VGVLEPVLGVHHDMKLILCKKCQDVVRLFDKPRWCKCGACGGSYLEGDDILAVYWGEYVVPLGFDNPALAAAVGEQSVAGRGRTFGAFVIPSQCDTFRQIFDKDIPRKAVKQGR